MKNKIDIEFEEIVSRFLVQDVRESDRARLHSIFQERTDLKAKYNSYKKLFSYVGRLDDSLLISLLTHETEEEKNPLIVEYVQSLGKKYPPGKDKLRKKHNRFSNGNLSIWLAAAASILVIISTGLILTLRTPEYMASLAGLNAERFKIDGNCTIESTDEIDRFKGGSTGCEMQIESGSASRLLLSPSSEIALKQKSDSLLIKIHKGGILIDVPRKASNENLLVLTGSGLASVRGTKFSVIQKENRDTVVEVVEGTVEYRRGGVYSSGNIDAVLMNPHSLANLKSVAPQIMKDESIVIEKGNQVIAPAPAIEEIRMINELIEIKQRSESDENNQNEIKNLYKKFEKEGKLKQATENPVQLKKIPEERFKRLTGTAPDLSIINNFEDDRISNQSSNQAADSAKKTNKSTHRKSANKSKKPVSKNPNNAQNEGEVIQRVHLKNGRIITGETWEEAGGYMIRTNRGVIRILYNEVDRIEMVNP